MHEHCVSWEAGVGAIVVKWSIVQWSGMRFQMLLKTPGHCMLL